MASPLTFRQTIAQMVYFLMCIDDIKMSLLQSMTWFSHLPHCLIVLCHPDDLIAPLVLHRD